MINGFCNKVVPEEFSDDYEYDSRCSSSNSDIYRRRHSVVDVPRLQTESGQISPTSPSALSHSAWRSALGIASVPLGTKQFISLNGERACSARQAEAR